MPATKMLSSHVLSPCPRLVNIDRIKFNEPSGIVFHPSRGTLFVVGDEGDICEIRKDGVLVKRKRISHADFEGITVDPSTGLLYVAVEGEEKIIEIDPGNFKVLRKFDIMRTFRNKMVLEAGGQGIEGITFAPDPGHPEGGTFFVVNQSFDRDDEKDISAVFEVVAPLRSARHGSAKIIKYFKPGVCDLSGIHYDKDRDRLYVISDITNTFFEITKNGVILKLYALPGDNQEGITVDDDGFAYLAQDSGGIIKLKWNREE